MRPRVAFQMTGVARTAVAVALLGVALRPEAVQAKGCEGRFVTPAPVSLAKDGSSPEPEVVVLDGRTVTIGGNCQARGGSKRTRQGWRIRVHWKRCGNMTKPRFAGSIDAACEQLTGTLHAKRQAPILIVAHKSRCGDGIVDPGRGEECDSSDGSACADCALTTPPTTTAPPVTVTTATTTTSDTELPATSTSTTAPTTTLRPIPATCGNGVADAQEECDGADLSGAICPDQGASVTCRIDCTL